LGIDKRSFHISIRPVLSLPSAPPGTYSGVGPDSITVDYKGGRNGTRGPDHQRLDFRARYRFRLPGGRTLDALFDLFNAANEPNLASSNTANTSSDRRVSASFLVLTRVVDGSPTRTAQINLRFGF
jgi:hypothetical protein